MGASIPIVALTANAGEKTISMKGPGRSNLRVGDFLIMDNLRVHKADEVLELIRSFGAKVLFIPPYSPEFNPIEKAWAKIKDILRSKNTRTMEHFAAAFEGAVGAVSRKNIKGWFAQCGYKISST